MKPTIDTPPVIIHIDIVNGTHYEWSVANHTYGEPIHVKDLDHVLFVANQPCEIHFLGDHYFQKSPLPLTKTNLGAVAYLKNRKVDDPDDRTSRWSVFVRAKGKAKKLKPLVLVNAMSPTFAMSDPSPVMDDGGSFACEFVDKGEPDPIIQP